MKLEPLQLLTPPPDTGPFAAVRDDLEEQLRFVFVETHVAAVTIVGHIVRWLKYSLAFYQMWLKSILAFTELPGSGRSDRNMK